MFTMEANTTGGGALKKIKNGEIEEGKRVVFAVKQEIERNPLITEAQRRELDHQVFIFNHFAYNLPLPHYLLQFPTLVSEYGRRGSDYRTMLDSEPHRCRRTDGKKWRCGKDTIPNQKYCERHIHRGRNRSRKLVETSQLNSPNLKTKPSNVSSLAKQVSKIEPAVSNPNPLVIQHSHAFSYTNKMNVYEVNQNQISKRIRFLGVRFSDFNFTIEFFRSVYLVQQGQVPRHAPKRVKSTLLLDKLDDISHQWINSDILIFNTGHWWVPSKLFHMGCYFQVGSSLKLGMSIPSAYRIALETWTSWIEREIDKNRTRVFFRTFEPSHWSDQTLRTCNVTPYPTFETNATDQNSFSDTVMEVVKNVDFPINILHVTSMSAPRSDAHVGNWNDNPSSQDCSHWCLPGVPDMWNEIILSQIFPEYDIPFWANGTGQLDD